MEPALAVTVGVVVASGLAGSAWWTSRRIAVACCLAAVLVGGVLLSPGALGEVAPPLVRLGEQHAARIVASETTYEVERGDSLWRIAEMFLTERTGAPPTSADIARFWPRIYAANRVVVGDDPCLIFPGQKLRIPVD
jgi:nucleoid-associated protein YgaU